MMLLQRRIFRELVTNTLVTAGLLMTVFLLLGSAQLLAEVEGIGFGLFMSTMPVVLTAYTDLFVPLSVLVAVVMTYGRLAADNEVDTVRASGISPWLLVTPGLVFGMLVTVMMVWAMDYGRPLADRELRRLMRGDDMAKVLASKLATGEPVFIADDVLVSAESLGNDGVARNLRIQTLDGEGVVFREIVAERAEMYVDLDRAELVVNLIEFRTTVGGALSGANTKIEIPLNRSLVDLNLGQHTTPQLISWIDKGPGRRGIFTKPARVQQEVDSRLSTAASCLVFVLLGLPVALRFRRSDRLGAFLVAFLLALFFYYPSVKISKALSSREIVDPIVAAWSGNVLLVCAGLFFSRRMFQR